MSVPFQPKGFHTLTPYLTVHDAVAAVAFYERALGAELTLKLTMPDGALAHAELRIGDSHLMLAQENPEWGNQSAKTLAGSPVSFMLYVRDVEAAFARAVEAGCTVVRPVEDQFYGDRTGTVLDPYGLQWSIGTHIEEVDQAEAQRRMEQAFGG